MEFKSIEEIQKHFGLTKNSIDDFRKELVITLAEYHPDKTGGTYRNKLQQRNYEEIDSAIAFIDESKKEVSITKHDLSLIIKKIDDLSIIASTKVSEVHSLDKTIERLDNSISTSIIQFQKKHLFPKISSLAITGALTILWTFPDIALVHPILKQFVVINNPIFTSFWFLSLFTTGFIWILTKGQERKDELIKKSYGFDSTQNNIFKLFLCWIQIVNLRAVDYNDHRKFIRFTKDELVNFTLNHYKNLGREFGRDLNSDLSSLYLKINKQYGKTDISRIREPENRINHLFSFSLFTKVGEIEIDFSQQISDNIINKLLKRGIINIAENQSFSETYEYLDKSNIIQ